MNFIQEFVKAHAEARLGVSRIQEILNDLNPGPEKTALSTEFEEVQAHMLDLCAFGQEMECNKSLWIDYPTRNRKRKYGQ